MRGLQVRPEMARAQSRVWYLLLLSFALSPFFCLYHCHGPHLRMQDVTLSGFRSPNSQLSYFNNPVDQNNQSCVPSWIDSNGVLTAMWSQVIQQTMKMKNCLVNSSLCVSMLKGQTKRKAASLWGSFWGTPQAGLGEGTTKEEIMGIQEQVSVEGTHPIGKRKGK